MPGSPLLRLRRAVARPDLALRKLRGTSVIDIELDEIAPYLPAAAVILEAGAFNGADTVRFSERWPHATVHAFEPLPEAYSQVAERTQHIPRIRTYQLALGTETGRRPLFREVATGPNGTPSGSSSLLEPSGHLEFFPEVAFEGAVDVEVVTLDDWALSESVHRIDLAWLDLQGMELPVLQAAPRMIDRIGALCLEVAREELYSGSSLYDEIVEWMGDHGFRVAIDRVPVIFGNMLFVRRQPLTE